MFYIGSTNDLRRRLSEHQQGKNTSTAKRLPLELIYFEGHLSKGDALRREAYFKTTKGKTTLKQMLRETLQDAQFVSLHGLPLANRVAPLAVCW